MELSIKLENGKWTINGKTFTQLSEDDKSLLAKAIKSIGAEIEDLRIQKAIRHNHSNCVMSSFL